VTDYSVVLVLISALVVVLIALYKKTEGLRVANKGRKFGNEIADSMGIQRGIFHSAIERGGLPMHMIILSQMRDEGVELPDARSHLLMYLDIGLHELENQFGPKDKISNAKSIISKYLAQSGKEGDDRLKGKVNNSEDLITKHLNSTFPHLDSLNENEDSEDNESYQDSVDQYLSSVHEYLSSVETYEYFVKSFDKSLGRYNKILEAQISGDVDPETIRKYLKTIKSDRKLLSLGNEKEDYRSAVIEARENAKDWQNYLNEFSFAEEDEEEFDDDGYPEEISVKEVIEMLREQATPFINIGFKIADEFYLRLANGEIVKISEVEKLIEDTEEEPAKVLNGFMRRMKEYVDEGEVVSHSIERGEHENDEIVFVHKDFGE
jgi:hypothetical protein